jgi:succinate dehydrogenase/fumarate reductase cytochrome b subunit
MRMLRRRRSENKHAPASLRARLHRWSGIVLLVFFAGHVIATRGASVIFHVYPEFAGIAFTLKWVPAYFWPYYLTFALAGMYHLVNGLGVALPILGVGEGRMLRRPRFLIGVSVIAGIALVAGMLGFGGALARPNVDPRHSPYAALLRRIGVAHDNAP